MPAIDMNSIHIAPYRADRWAVALSFFGNVESSKAFGRMMDIARWIGRAGLRAGAIHLSISAFVALLAMAVVFYVWYPGELARAQGVSGLVLVMIGVDVVTGPLLTTLLYKPGKWGLRFDLCIIAVLQVAALAYGLTAIHGGRPAYVVFNIDRFDVVAAQNVDAASLRKVAPEFEMSMLHPRWVSAHMPEDPTKRSDLLFSAINGGPDLPQMPEYFVPLEADRPIMLKALHPLAELRKLNELSDTDWAAKLQPFDRAEAELGYLPMRANAQDGAVVMDARGGQILGILLLTPDFNSPN